MRADCFSVFRRMIGCLPFAVLACGLISFGVSTVIAAENPASSVFKDPYNGGIKLPKGGGEPGKAYMVFIKALYSKNHMRICKLMADPAEVPQCLQQKEALDGYIAMFTQPKSHKVLNGFLKGKEATLNVLYTHTGAAPSSGFVVMKKAKNGWVVSSTGGSGSANVSAEASGTADLAGGSSAAIARAGQAPEAEYGGPALGKWAFTGKDDQGAIWSGTIVIGKLDPERYDTKKYNVHIILNMKSSDSERGIDEPCKWEPGKRELSCITGIGDYKAVLSPDGKSLINGKWTESEEDWDTRKAVVKKTGVWSATYSGAHAETGSAPASGGATVNRDPEFAVIQISPNMEEYTGKCPVSITYTADITFKMPLPDKFSYRWERSDGKKTRDRVVKPPRSGHLSIKEVWRGGRPGEKHDISMRFVAESGGAQMILDPPGAKVICK